MRIKQWNKAEVIWNGNGIGKLGVLKCLFGEIPRKRQGAKENGRVLTFSVAAKFSRRRNLNTFTTVSARVDGAVSGGIF